MDRGDSRAGEPGFDLGEGQVMRGSILPRQGGENR